jgi:hypothetical protein
MSDREDPSRTSGRAVQARRESREMPAQSGQRLASGTANEAERAPGSVSDSGPRAPARLAPPPPSAQRNRRPAAAAIAAAVPGIRGCSVGDLEGNLLDQHGEAANAQDAIMTSAVLAQHLSIIGARFGLGKPALVTTRGAGRTLVLAYQADFSIAVDIEPTRPLASIEAALRNTDWQSTTDWVLSDRDIEYVSEHPVSGAVTSRPPPRKNAAAPSAPAPVESAGSHAAILAECVLLRRALIDGQLLSAAQSAARLRQWPSPADHPFGSPSGVLPPFLTAIADIVAGDVGAGLSNLQLVRDTPEIGPSLEWTAQVWSARASARVPGGLAAANQYAESALRTSESLDREAHAVSLLLLAELKHQEGEWGRALGLIETARAAFSELGQTREVAASWLLEANVWSALRRHRDSLDAAEQAREASPSWPPPVTFIVRHALGAGQLDEAEQALDGLLALTPVPPEAVRDRRLIDYAREGAVPAATACRYLELLEAPAGTDTLRRFQEIAAGYPHVAQFRETLGWKLLEAGEPEAARKVFERLNERQDLPDDLRASVRLGLGCLATTEARAEPPSVKLRAVVNAAAHPFGTSEPAATAAAPTTTPRKTDPMDLRVRSSKLTPSPGNPHVEQGARRKARGGPSFVGSLQLQRLPDLLEVLRTGQKTGTLVCSSSAGIGAIHLRSGKVTGAAAPSSSNLCDYLVARGALTHQQLRAIEQIVERSVPAAPVDLTLLEQGVVTIEQVQQGLCDQVLAAFRELLEWRDGQFAFDREMAQPAPSAVEIELDVPVILAELQKMPSEPGDAH